ncbi:hypothetical protein ACHAQA_000484 [Verticillium albo-atrum]
MANNYGRAPGYLRRKPSVYNDKDDETGLRRRNYQCRSAARYRGQAAQDMKEDGTLADPKDADNYASLIAGQGNPVDQLVRALHEPDLAIEGDRKRKRDDDNVGLGITLAKMFGVSGCGIAALVNVPAVNGAGPYQSVMKVDKRTFDDVEKEEGLLQHFKAVRAASKKPNRKSSSHYRDRLNIGTDWKRNFIMMEYAELGSLLGWLQRTSAHAADPDSDLGPWPDKALWQLFECLVLGLIGMAYAPHGRQDNGPVSVADEKIPPAPAPDIRQRTHFDLDPGNEWDNFKDFMSFGDNESKNRFLGQGFPKPPVAGNYGMPSNVFQVGIILWMAITLHVPPGAEAGGERPADGVGVVVDSMFTRSNGQTVRTYGGALADERFNHVEVELRELVIRCMAHDPADRPDLAELFQIIQNRLQGQFPVDGAELDQWYQDMFARPSPQGDGGNDNIKNDGDDDNGKGPRPRKIAKKGGGSFRVASERVSREEGQAADELTEDSLQTLRDALGIARAMQLRAAANPVYVDLVNVLNRVPGIRVEEDAMMHGAGGGGDDDNGGGGGGDNQGDDNVGGGGGGNNQGGKNQGGNNQGGDNNGGNDEAGNQEEDSRGETGGHERGSKDAAREAERKKVGTGKRKSPPRRERRQLKLSLFVNQRLVEERTVDETEHCQMRNVSGDSRRRDNASQLSR